MYLQFTKYKYCLKFTKIQHRLDSITYELQRLVYHLLYNNEDGRLNICV